MFFFWIFRSREKTDAERAQDRKTLRWSFLTGLLLAVLAMLWLLH